MRRFIHLIDKKNYLQIIIKVDTQTFSSKSCTAKMVLQLTPQASQPKLLYLWSLFKQCCLWLVISFIMCLFLSLGHKIKEEG